MSTTSKGSFSFHVGDHVRVLAAQTGDLANIAVVACVNSNGTFDIIYNKKAHEESDEEQNVSGNRLSALEPFELADNNETSPLELKNQGNVLFQTCKDLDAATAHYTRALDGMLRGMNISVGSTVLVESEGSTFRAGMVSDVDDESNEVEVMFDAIAMGGRVGFGIDDNDVSDEEEEEGEEEAIVSKERVVLVAKNFDVTAASSSSPLPRDAASNTGITSIKAGVENSSLQDKTTSVSLQRALYMNLARCCMKRVPPRPGWAVRWASLAIALSHLEATLAAEEAAANSVRGFGCRSISVDTANKPLSDVDQGNSIHATDSHKEQAPEPFSFSIIILRFVWGIIQSVLRYFLVLESGTGTTTTTTTTLLQPSLQSHDSSSRNDDITSTHNGDNNIKSLPSSLYTERRTSGVKTNNSKISTGEEDESKPPSLSDQAENAASSAAATAATATAVAIQTIQKQLVDGYFMRAKAFLAASRPQLAKKDANKVKKLDPLKAAGLLREIDAFREKRLKINRKLARDVANWVDTAMKMSADAKGSSSSADRGGEAVDGDDDLQLGFEDCRDD